MHTHLGSLSGFAIIGCSGCAQSSPRVLRTARELHPPERVCKTIIPTLTFPSPSSYSPNGSTVTGEGTRTDSDRRTGYSILQYFFPSSLFAHYASLAHTHPPRTTHKLFPPPLLSICGHPAKPLQRSVSISCHRLRHTLLPLHLSISTTITPPTREGKRKFRKKKVTRKTKYQVNFLRTAPSLLSCSLGEIWFSMRVGGWE